MTSNYETDLSQHSILTSVLKKRFKYCCFDIKCFSSVEEIETKVLTEEDYFLFVDHMKEKVDCCDYFMIYKKPLREFIRYCDVIDYLRLIDFSHGDKSLLDIRPSKVMFRNDNSISVFCAEWSE
jgi:hypothetical protein